MRKTYYEEIPTTIEEAIGRLKQESKNHPYVVVDHKGYVGGSYASVSSILSGGGKRFIFRSSDIKENFATNLMPGRDEYFNSIENIAKEIING
jgi:hypothetical protein